MTCIHLTGSSILSCRARSGVYVPSLGELKQFCMNTGHLCPAQTAEEASARSFLRSAACWLGRSDQGDRKRGTPAP